MSRVNPVLVYWKIGLCQIDQKLSVFSNQQSGPQVSRLRAES